MPSAWTNTRRRRSEHGMSCMTTLFDGQTRYHIPQFTEEESIRVVNLTTQPFPLSSPACNPGVGQLAEWSAFRCSRASSLSS